MSNHPLIAQVFARLTAAYRRSRRHAAVDGARQRPARWQRSAARAGTTLLFVLGTGLAHAQDAQLQFIIENDLLSRTDRYYTNGFKIGFGTPPSSLVNDASRGLLNQLVAGGDEIETGWFLGQNMYTPKDIGIAAAQPFDRPWGAWLYLGAVAQRAHRDHGKPVDRVDTVEVDVGVIGPAALGEQVQKAVHERTGSRTPQGWHNQSPSEPAFSVTLLRKWKVAGNEHFDVIPHFGASVGTVMTLARVGGVARLGYGLSGFGVDTIEPGGAILQSTRTRQLREARSRFEAYAFAGVDQRLVLYNTFLDGPVFHDGPRVDRRPHVYDLVVGASMRWSVLRLSLTRVRRSEEFTTAAGGGGPQTFHSFNIGLEW